MSKEAEAELWTVRHERQAVSTGAKGEGQGREAGLGRLEKSPHLPPPPPGLLEGCRPVAAGGGGAATAAAEKVEECLQLRPRINKPHSGLGGGRRHVSLLKLEKA